MDQNLTYYQVATFNMNSVYLRLIYIDTTRKRNDAINFLYIIYYEIFIKEKD